MTERFTPGPWTVEIDHIVGTNVPEIYSANVCVGEADSFDGPKSEDERIANAHLIASAPELYSSLSELINNLCATDEEGLFAHSDLYTNAVNALAKARGEHD